LESLGVNTPKFYAGLRGAKVGRKEDTFWELTEVPILGGYGRLAILVKGQAPLWLTHPLLTKTDGKGGSCWKSKDCPRLKLRKKEKVNPLGKRLAISVKGDFPGKKNEEGERTKSMREDD